ncbi:ABC transporter permease [Nocardioides pantholopis]|uniref:ABC transporter permease n=1 Tax=Nocardioides pantholopis TaxID=2483798 RepID=UPI000F079DE8|nr:FtsX-like permease family protein [Nocardioides pantholopis]
MRTVLLASLRTHARRYVAAVVAITIGVGFIVVTGALASATRNGVTAGVGLPYRNADVVVSELDGSAAAEVLAHAAENGGSAAVLGWSIQPVTSAGRLLDERADVGVLAEDPALRWQELRSGRYPGAVGETVADTNAAKVYDIEAGDVLRVGTGSRATEVTVVGLVDTPSAWAGAAFYLPWSTVGAWASSLQVDSVAYAGPGSAADQVEELGALTGASVQPRREFVEQRQTTLNNEIDVIAGVLLLFAAIALFVSVIVIANTFAILFAQRTRDFALLRCVGSTRRQLLRAVRVEALALGVVASALGLAAGTAGGHGLVALTADLLPEGIMGAVEISARWYAAGAVVGIGVTLVAAWLPTRRVVRVSPLAALRPDTGVDLRTSAGRWRTATGAVLVLGGGAALAAAIAAHSAQLMVAGGAASFGGVLLLGPLLVPALISAAGALTRRLGGPAARLATGNAVRHPRRTAATTASLLIGVTLTTAVLTGLASARGSVATDMDRSHPLDAALTTTDGPLPPTLLPDVRAAYGVVDAVALDGTDAVVSGVGPLQVLAPPAAAADVVRDRRAPSIAAPRPGRIWLPSEELNGDVPSRVRVTAGDRTVTLDVDTGDTWGSAALVAPATLAALTDSPTPRAVWVRAGAGTDAEDLAGDLTALAAAAGADLVSGLSSRAWVDLQLDVLTGAVVALLGIAVLIALVGIGNTLGLSVIERARENALLRALGLTRRQLRRMLATEAVLLSVVATVLGTAIGVTFAWVAVQTLVANAVDEAPLVLPWGQLALVVLVAGVAGLLAGVLPSRRAARVAPAAGLALD